MNLMLKSVVALGVTALLTGAATAQTYWDMAVPNNESNPHTQNALQFAKDIGAATGGKLVIKVLTSGARIKHADIKPAVRRGATPIGEILASLIASESPIYGVDSVPFLTAGYADARKLYAAQKPFLEKKLDGEGLKLLYSVPWPPQGLYARKEIKAIEDVSGLKFRTYNAATNRLALLMKAVPAKIEAADIAAAFKTGRVELMVASPTTGVDTKAWGYLTHYHDLKGWQPRNIAFINKDAFGKLPADQQKAVLDAAAAAEARGWAASEKETERTTKSLADNKITVVQPTAALREALVKIGGTLSAEWEKSAGADGAEVLKSYRSK